MLKRMSATGIALAASLLMVLASDGVARAGEIEGTATAADPGSDGYTLDAGDRLRVTVYNEPALSGFFTISDRGNLSFPIIGDVPARNKTAEQLQKDIHDRLAAGDYVKDAQVAIELVSYRPYYILGEVNRPGQYPYVAGLKLQQAIAAAGGYTYRANRGTAFIEHSNAATEERVKIKGTGHKIRPGDTIRIGERYL